jgi:VCBS repeat-containing protein
MPMREGRMRPIRLVIADRRPVVLQGFESLLAAERDFEIVASCLDGAGCLEAVRNLTPDVVLVEDGFSDVTASEMLDVVNALNLPTRLVFYTASVARGDLAAAIAAGACSAIPMRERPETLLQSLRLVAPIPRPAAAGKKENSTFGENGLAALTDHERQIMRLVACGMSNREIARQLQVSTGTIKAHLDRISSQLEIKNRKELAVFALSHLYGGVGALAALIFAALNDFRAADATTSGHTSSDTFTVLTGEGTAEIVAIKISPKKAAAASSKTAKAVFKAGRIENSASDAPVRTGKLIESSVDIAANRTTLPALNSPSLGLSSYSMFMMTAVGVLVYELLNNPAQAFNGGDSPTDVSAVLGGNWGLLALNAPGSAGVTLDGLDNFAWLNPEIYHQSFAFDAGRSDAIARCGDEVQIIYADATEDGITGNGDSHIGSGAIEALINHGGVEAIATDASKNAEHDTIQAIAEDESNRGQSQRDLHVAEDGGAAIKLHPEHDPPGNDSNYGQLQRQLHASEGGAAAGKQHARHAPSGDDLNHGQSQRDLRAAGDDAVGGQPHAKHGSPVDDYTHGQSQRDMRASEDAPAVKQHAKHGPSGDDFTQGQSQSELQASGDEAAIANQHAKDGARQGSGANSDQSQHDLHEKPVYDTGSAHAVSSRNAGGKNHATDDLGRAHTTAASDLGDSFHFKNELAAAKASDIFEEHGGHVPHSIEHGLPIAEQDGLAPIEEADMIGPSHAEQTVVDHAKGVAHHLTHDLFV